MELRWRTDVSALRRLVEAYSATVERQVVGQALRLAAQVVVRRIKEKMAGAVLKRRTGRLSRSVKAGSVFRTGSGWGIEIGSNVVYARIHEYGGTIRPTRGQFLAIPLAAAKTAAGVARFTPRTAPGPTFFATSRRGNLILFQRRQGGGITPLFVMKRSVTIPARPIWRPALQESLPEITALFDHELDRALREIA